MIAGGRYLRKPDGSYETHDPRISALRLAGLSVLVLDLRKFPDNREITAAKS